MLCLFFLKLFIFRYVLVIVEMIWKYHEYLNLAINVDYMAVIFNLDKLPSPSNLSSYRTQGQQPLTATNPANQLCRPPALDRVQGRHPNAKALLVPGSFLPQLFPKTMKLPQLCNVSSTCDIVAASRHLWSPNALMLKN